MTAADLAAMPADRAVPTKRYRRRQKLIQPGLQLKIGVIFVFVLISTLGFFAARLHLVVANHGGVHGEQVRADFSSILRSELLVALAMGIALTMAVAVAVTFRLAGPVYRMGQFLKAVRGGTQVAPCKLRKGDAFGDLCGLINEATEEQRRQNETTADSHGEPAVEVSREASGSPATSRS